MTDRRVIIEGLGNRSDAIAHLKQYAHQNGLQFILEAKQGTETLRYDLHGDLTAVGYNVGAEGDDDMKAWLSAPDVGQEYKLNRVPFGYTKPSDVALSINLAGIEFGDTSLPEYDDKPITMEEIEVAEELACQAREKLDDAQDDLNAAESTVEELRERYTLQLEAKLEGHLLVNEAQLRAAGQYGAMLQWLENYQIDHQEPPLHSADCLCNTCTAGIGDGP